MSKRPPSRCPGNLHCLHPSHPLPSSFPVSAQLSPLQSFPLLSLPEDMAGASSSLGGPAVAEVPPSHQTGTLFLVDFQVRGGVLDCSNCYNKNTTDQWLKQQTFISDGSGGWEVQDQGAGLFLFADGCPLAVSSWLGAERQRKQALSCLYLQRN